MGQCVNRWKIGVGELVTTDQVLSDQKYKGVSISLSALHIGNYKKADKHIFWSFTDKFRYSSMLNASKTARLHYVSLGLDFGTHYLFDLPKGFKLSVGGLADVYGAVRYVPRNVNNIASADVQLGLRAIVTAHYLYRFHEGFAIGCHYGVSSPLIGCFFSPEYGESYYEIWKNMSGSLARDVRFSSFHNRQGVRGELDLDFVFNHGVLTVGFSHENEWWHAAGNAFSIADIKGTLGFALRLVSIRPY